MCTRTALARSWMTPAALIAMANALVGKGLRVSPQCARLRYQTLAHWSFSSIPVRIHDATPPWRGFWAVRSGELATDSRRATHQVRPETGNEVEIRAL